MPRVESGKKFCGRKELTKLMKLVLGGTEILPQSSHRQIIHGRLYCNMIGPQGLTKKSYSADFSISRCDVAARLSVGVLVFNSIGDFPHTSDLFGYVSHKVELQYTALSHIFKGSFVLEASHDSQVQKTSHIGYAMERMVAILAGGKPQQHKAG